jgi:hypothetical protein
MRQGIGIARVSNQGQENEMSASDYNLAQEIAGERESAHDHEGHHAHPENPLIPHKIGCLGEIVFAREFGLSVDRTRRSDGDSGCDFIVQAGIRRLKIDVKTNRHPDPYLLVETEKIRRSHIYVLAHAFMADDESPYTARLLGWEIAGIVACYPIRDFGHGMRNHWMPANALRPMQQLRELLAIARLSHQVMQTAGKARIDF